MTREHKMVLNYLYFLRANKVQTLAQETEYDGEYHIHLYKLTDVIAFVESLQGDEIMQLMRYKDGFRCRPFTCGGYTSTRKPRNQILYDLVITVDHEEIYSQEKRILWREVEKLTRMEIGGYDISKLKNTKCDLKLLQGYGLTECKAMGGMWCFGDKRDDELEWIVG